MTEDITCPDFVPDFGELQHETGWWYHSCERMHPEDPLACVGKLATLDQDYSAAEEFHRRFASEPVIVGTYSGSTSAWRREARAPVYTDDAPGWLGVDPDVIEALKCDHLQAGPRPAFRYAEYPHWVNCHDCHWTLIVGMALSTGGFRCKRCRCRINVDNLRLRALIAVDLLQAVVCAGCARVFDRAEPRANKAPAPGTAIYAARVSERANVEDFARRLRDAGVIKPQESEPE